MENVKDSIYKFDVLRGIAIILVFTIHSLFAFFPNFDVSYGKYTAITQGKSTRDLLFAFSPLGHGWTGVELFLIISGFLIHYSYLKKGVELDFKTFITKRFFRIYPPYLLVMLIYFFSNFNFDFSLGNFFSHFFLLHNFNGNYFFGINGSFWSLALEFQLYLLYPLFLLMRKRIGIFKTIYFLVFLYFVISSLLYCLKIDGPQFSTIFLRFWVVWGLGALVGETYINKERIFKFSNLTIFGFCLIYLLSKYFQVFQYLGLIEISLLYAIIVEKYLYSNNQVNKFEKGMISFGLASYSFYLIHQPLIMPLSLAFNFLNMSNKSATLFWLTSWCLVLIIIFLISYSMHKLIELKSVSIGEKVINFQKKQKVS